MRLISHRRASAAVASRKELLNRQLGVAEDRSRRFEEKFRTFAGTEPGIMEAVAYSLYRLQPAPLQCGIT